MSKCKVIAICNQKGGVTKTTTTANLGIGLAMQGKRVLLVDADPQSDLTTALGWPESDKLPETLSTIMDNIIHDASLIITAESCVTMKALTLCRRALSYPAWK